MKKLFLLSSVVAVTMTPSGCGGGSETGVTVDEAWARTSPAMATTGAAYLAITAGEDDELVGASVDSSIAASAEIHETVMADDAMADDSMGDQSDGEAHAMEGMGEMTMQEVDGIPLPAGETVSLEPGGYHIMMFDLVEPLEAGATFDMTLTFANAGEQVVTVEVRDDAP